jgi:hypothetical protein
LLAFLFTLATGIYETHADRVNPYRFESTLSVFHRPGISSWARAGALFAPEGLDRTGPRYSSSVGIGRWIDPRFRVLDVVPLDTGGGLDVVVDGRLVLSGVATGPTTAIIGMSGMAFPQIETDRLVGWQTRVGTTIAALDVGLVERVDWSAERLIRYGARAQGGILWTDASSRFASVDWRWTSIDNATQATARVGFPIGLGMKLGPEAGLFTKLGSRHFGHHVGLALTGISFLGLDISIAGGFARDEMGRNARYVSLHVAARSVIWRSTLDWGEDDD